MLAPFEASRIKIDRAKRHLQEFRSEVDSYFRRGGAYVAFEIAEEYSRATGGENGSFTYREPEPIPNSWAAIIGDTIHNLRASLDLLASDVHRITEGKPKDAPHVHYPFCNDKSGLPDMIKLRRLNHIGKEFLDLIKLTAPYKGGNVGLRAVHDLDLLDKHQALIPTVSIVAMDWPVEIKQGPKQFTTGAAKDGQRLMIFPTAFAKLPNGSRIKADFSIAFGEVGTFMGADISKQLTACVVSIEAIVNLFRASAESQGLLGVGSP
jgi:hypothetical protein